MPWVWEEIIIIELISKTVSSETPGFLWKLSASLETNLFSSEAQNNIWQRFPFWAQPSRFSSVTPRYPQLSVCTAGDLQILKLYHFLLSQTSQNMGVSGRIRGHRWKQNGLL